MSENMGNVGNCNIIKMQFIFFRIFCECQLNFAADIYSSFIRIYNTYKFMAMHSNFLLCGISRSKLHSTSLETKNIFISFL